LPELCGAKSLVYLALANLMRTLPDEQAARCWRHLQGQHRIAPALEHIDANLDHGLDNASLARLCHVSEDHFIRLFRQLLRQTPAQYVLDRRVSVAAQRLIFSQESIDAIAEQCGFRDRYYFSRVFAQRMGLPPATYRRSDRV
jgi:AraC family transcriptional regulator